MHHPCILVYCAYYITNFLSLNKLSCLILTHNEDCLADQDGDQIIPLVSSLLTESTSVRLQTLQRKIKMKIRKNLVFIIITIVVSVLLLLFVVPMLLVGAV